MIKKTIFYLCLAFVFLLASCKKDEDLNLSGETIIQDSVLVYSGGSYKLDLTNDKVNDIEFYVYGYHSPGGYGKMEYKLVLHNPQFKVHTISKNDTFCLDQVTSGGYNGTYLHNCYSTDFNKVDADMFAPLIDENNLKTSDYNFLYDDSTLIYRTVSQSLSNGITYPNYYISDTNHGAFMSKKEGYIVVKGPDGKRKAILINATIPYLRIKKIKELD